MVPLIEAVKSQQAELRSRQAEIQRLKAQIEQFTSNSGGQ
jgi:prefoldin subunit 5